MVITPATAHSTTGNPLSAGTNRPFTTDNLPSSTANRPSSTANQPFTTANQPFTTARQALHGSRQNGLVGGNDQKKCNLVLYFTRFALPL